MQKIERRPTKDKQLDCEMVKLIATKGRGTCKMKVKGTIFSHARIIWENLRKRLRNLTKVNVTSHAKDNGKSLTKGQEERLGVKDEFTGDTGFLVQKVATTP